MIASGFYYVNTAQIRKQEGIYYTYILQGVSKRVLQLYSNCYCVASVKKTFTLN
jgi:hypothetical protein